MAWIDASTDVYWTAYDDNWGPNENMGYIGEGHWRFEGNGVTGLAEDDASPLKEQYDEYTYTYIGENVTVSGIRIHYTFAKHEYWDAPYNFWFITNYARESQQNIYRLTEGNAIQEWTFDPDIDERITKIIVPAGFSDNYSATAIITKIELRTSMSPDPVWRDYQNTRESYQE